MTVRENPECQIWPWFRAERITRHPGPERRADIKASPHAGGDYSIIYEAAKLLNSEPNRFDEYVRARLTTILVDMRASGEEWPLVTVDLIETAEIAKPLTPVTRADRLLRFMRTTVASDLLPIPMLAPDVWPAALAHSESVRIDELDQLLKHLESRGWVELPTIDMFGFEPTITVAGIDRIETLSHADRSPVGFSVA